MKVENLLRDILRLLEHNEFMINIIEGNVLSKRRRGRPRKPLLKDIKHGMQIIKYCNMK